MTTLTITNERLNLFVFCAKQYLNTTPRSKLWFAVDKILKIAIKKLKKVEERKNEKRRDHALKLDKGVFDTKDDGSFKYDVKGHKDLVADLLLIDEDTVEVPVHIIPDGEFDEKLLSFDIRNAFEGIVIPVIDYDFDIETVKPQTHES